MPLFVLKLFWLSALASLSLLGQNEAAMNPLQEGELEESVLFEWRYRTAHEALDYGLYNSAVRMFKTLLGSNDAERSEILKEDLRSKYIKSLIETQDLSGAREQLNQTPEAFRQDAYYLQVLVVDYLSELKGSKKYLLNLLNIGLENINSEVLVGREQAWFYFFKGLSQELGDKSDRARNNYSQAQSLADRGSEEAFFNSLIMRLDYDIKTSDSKLLKTLRKLLRENSNQKEAYYYAYDYAYMLALKGDQNKSIEVINTELEKGDFLYSAFELDNLRLLKVLILGPGSKAGRDLLLTMMQVSENTLILDRCYRLFIMHYQSSDLADFSNAIDSFLKAQESHYLRPQFYLLKASTTLEALEISLLGGNIEQQFQLLDALKADAESILEEFPGTESLSKVYHLLVYVALKQPSPQYRLAADYLSQIALITEDEKALYKLNQLIGDCYFLNEDFAVAADYYWNVLSRQSDLSRMSKGDLWLCYIVSKMRLGELDSVVELFNQASASSQISESSYCMIEWNLALGLKNSGQVNQAVNRLSEFFKNAEGSDIPAALKIRLQWMELYLKYSAGIDGSRSVSEIESILKKLNGLKAGILDPRELSLLQSQVRLLKGQFLLSAGREAEGLNTLKYLQSNYSETLAAELSYIIIADYYSKDGFFDQAEVYLLELAEGYPESEYAPEAILEAALNAEKREPNSFNQAIRLLNQIVENYQDSHLVFFALRHQGDLLRRSGDFSAAMTIYEGIIQKFPSNSNRHLVELSRIDCLLALVNRDNLFSYKEIVVELERLLDLPYLPVPFQIEVGYKLTFVLSEIEDLEASIEVGLSIISRFLDTIQPQDEMSSISRYWIARSMFLLCDNLIKTNSPEEAKKIYRMMIAYKLPGQELVKQFLSKL